MSLLWRPLLRARRRIPKGARGVTGQFDHLPLPLPYDIAHGLGKFLPPPALETVAVEYQLGLLTRLTDEVRHSEEEGLSVTQTVISTAPYRHKTLAFNYASLALNNSFFLGRLTPDPEASHENCISASLASQLRTDHGGLDQFKSAFSSAAMGIFTSGYVWFVTDKQGSTSIIPTFGPGTLLVRSRTYMAEDHPTLWHRQTPISPYNWDRGRSFMEKYMPGWEGSVPAPLQAEPESALEVDEVPRTLTPEEGVQEMVSDSALENGTSSTLAPEDGVEEVVADSELEDGTPSSAPAPGAYQKRFMHTSAVARQQDRDEYDNDDAYDPDDDSQDRLPNVAEFGAQPAGVYADPSRKSPFQAGQPAPTNTSAALHAGEVLYPLFCISVHEHAWLSAGYGVWGKEAWLREFWSVVNWREVSEEYERLRNAN
uniref:Manganese superoxide dismutase n=1 Tax=Mycena chlorophos TaxID=658473 RepID=A0ABQ0LRP8_MYCCL|nr:manganese superoxide dismutase [Mycena chlorophos]